MMFSGQNEGVGFVMFYWFFLFIIVLLAGMLGDLDQHYSLSWRIGLPV